MGLPRRHTDGLYTGNVFGELVNLIGKTQMSVWCSYLEGSKKNKIIFKKVICWDVFRKSVPVMNITAVNGKIYIYINTSAYC